MNIYLASANVNKAEEINRLIVENDIKVVLQSAASVGGMPFVDEDKDTFVGNAKKKAEALLKILPEGSWVLADDSGVCVECLKGAPGVRSARFAGENSTDEANNKKLLATLADEPVKNRKAAFQCALVLLGPRQQEYIFEGECQGSIAFEMRGDFGFGYDSLFQPEGYWQTFAELGSEIKDKISHRSEALAKLLYWLKNNFRKMEGKSQTTF